MYIGEDMCTYHFLYEFLCCELIPGDTARELIPGGIERKFSIYGRIERKYSIRSHIFTNEYPAYNVLLFLLSLLVHVSNVRWKNQYDHM